MADEKEKYPALGELLEINSLPEALNFINDGIDFLTKDIYVKDHIVSSHHSILNIHHELTLLVFKKIGVEIPGTGIQLLLNSSYAKANEDINAEIPVSLSITLPIKEYIDNFSVANFGNPLDYLNVITQIVGQDEIQMVVNFLRYSQKTSLEFVTDINTHYNLTIPLNPTLTGELYTDVDLIETEIYNNQEIDKTIVEVYFDLYFSDITVQEILDLFNNIFEAYFDKKPIDFIKDLLIPEIQLYLNASAAIEFPHNILLPIGVDGKVDETVNMRLLFDIGDIYFHSKHGFGFHEDLFTT